MHRGEEVMLRTEQAAYSSNASSGLYSEGVQFKFWTRYWLARGFTLLSSALPGKYQDSAFNYAWPLPSAAFSIQCSLASVQHYTAEVPTGDHE
jgi:hypothetical protein